ncbi:zinc-ribbon domain-containing protein, partial [Variovorax sp. CT11-76]
MSLVTRGPACATTFTVVRDQLRISDGWVRCGRCSHVFDATLDLQETPDAAGVAGAPRPAHAKKNPRGEEVLGVKKNPPPPAPPPPHGGPPP